MRPGLERGCGDGEDLVWNANAGGGGGGTGRIVVRGVASVSGLVTPTATALPAP